MRHGSYNDSLGGQEQTLIDTFKQSIKAVFWALSIVYISIKLRCGSWILFRLQIEEEGTLAVGPPASDLRPGLRLAQPGGPTARVSVLPILLEDGRRSSFRNVILLK
jgi:hypothetical protein